MGHTTIPHPAPFKLWGTALIVLVAVAVTVLLAVSLSATPAPPSDVPGPTTDTPPATTPCGLPPAVAQAEGLDPRTCATPREELRITGPR